VQASAPAAQWLAAALANVSTAEANRAACVAAGAAEAVMRLARAPAAAGDCMCAREIARAAGNIAVSALGRAAAHAAGLADALAALAASPEIARDEWGVAQLQAAHDRIIASE
jgi:hypothetical protein